MPEYFAHILNWPCNADTPEGAAREMYNDIQNIVHPFFTVTEKEIDMEGVESEGFDAEEWYTEDGEEIQK